MTGNWIESYSGQKLFPYAPTVEQINLVDIAASLAKLCRFGGHCSVFYSVAQHSVLTSQKVSPTCARYALLHDAAESFIGDIASPIKKPLLAGGVPIKAIENAILWAVFEHFGIPINAQAEKETAEADLRMLATERRDVWDRPCLHDWDCLRNVVPYVDKIEALPWQAAQDLFLQRAAELGLA